MSRRLVLCLVLVGLLALDAGSAGAAKTYSADRFDVNATLQPGGDVFVEETVVFRFSGGPFTFVFRDLPTDHTDGIRDIAATMDGVAMTPGKGPGQVELANGNPIKVRWHFANTSDSTHTFGLRYRLLGVVRQDAGADRLLWNALPEDYEYSITSARVMVSYPEGVALAGNPQVTRGEAQVESGPGKVTFLASDLAPKSELQISLAFPPGSLVTTSPAWQARDARALRAAPGIGLAALLVLLTGAGGLAALYTLRRREQPASAQAMTYTRPPDGLAPAVAGALNGSGGGPALPNALGALFDLARRGVLSIEESPEHSWYRAHEFILRLPGGGSAEPLRLHERGLLSLMFEDKHGTGADSLKLSEMQTRLSTRWKTFAEPLKQEMEQAGFFSPERRQVRRRLVAAGIMLILACGVALVCTALFFSLFEAWTLLVAGALFLLSLIAFILSAAYSLLSDLGADEAARWQAFYRYLKDVAKGREGALSEGALSGAALSESVFESYLPFAASYGLAESWAKAFVKQSGVELPDWFHPLAATRAADGGVGAFVAMSTAAQAAGSNGGGAAGAGGAAGGGASGAG